MVTDKGLAQLKPVISAKAIEKSGRVLKALSLLYLPFHGLKSWELFDLYGPVAFVSCAIYQSDELNEQDDMVSAPSLKPIRDYLAEKGLLDDWIFRYLEDGENYLIKERYFRKIAPCTLDEILVTMRLRSSDFRILHCLLHRLTGQPYEPITFKAYEAFEMLMEVNDDIASYNDDVEAGTFNFLRQLSLLPSTDDATKTAEVLREDIIQRIDDACGSLPKIHSKLFTEILSVYAEIVPKPNIPQVSRSIAACL